MAISRGESGKGRVGHGGAIPGLESPSFTLVSPESPPIPVVIAVPHGGRTYPGSLLAEMRDPDYSSLRLEDRFTDELGAEIARLTGASLLVSHAPRAMLDLNRSRDDVDWEMIAGQRPHAVRHSQANRRSRSGLGLIPRRLPGFGEIWRGKMSREELEARIEGIHLPYHAALGRELAAIRDKWGQALLIDLHSMPPLKRSNGQDHAPHYVIGDRFGTACDLQLASTAFRLFEQSGKAVSHNRPYAGGYVLDTHGSPRHGIHALQLEICRSTYLDSKFEQLSPRSGSVVKLLAGIVRELGAQTAQMAADPTDRLAAE